VFGEVVFGEVVSALVAEAVERVVR